MTRIIRYGMIYTLYIIYCILYTINHILCILYSLFYYPHPSQQAALPVVNCGNGTSEMLAFAVNVTAELTHWLRNEWRVSRSPGWLPSHSLSPHTGEEAKQAERLAGTWYFYRMTPSPYFYQMHKVFSAEIARGTKWMVKPNGTCGISGLFCWQCKCASGAWEAWEGSQCGYRRHHSLGNDTESENCSVNA